MLKFRNENLLIIPEYHLVVEKYDDNHVILYLNTPSTYRVQGTMEEIYQEIVKLENKQGVKNDKPVEQTATNPSVKQAPKKRVSNTKKR